MSFQMFVYQKDKKFFFIYIDVFSFVFLKNKLQNILFYVVLFIFEICVFELIIKWLINILNG